MEAFLSVPRFLDQTVLMLSLVSLGIVAHCQSSKGQIFGPSLQVSECKGPFKDTLANKLQGNCSFRYGRLYLAIQESPGMGTLRQGNKVFR